MGSGGGNVKQKTAPWEAASPYLKGLMADAQGIYNQGGFSPDPYQGNRVAGLSGASRGAYDEVMSRGAGSPMIDRAFGGISGLMRNGGVPQGMTNGTGMLRGMSRGDPRLDRMTSGKDIYRDLDAVKQNALGSAIPAAVSMFSGSGMTDSGAAMDTVGRAATEAVAPIDYAAWQGAQDRRLSAIGMDNSTRLAAQGQDFGQRLGALGQRQAGQLGAAGMAPAMQAASYLPAQMQAQFGQQRDVYNQANIDAQMQKWYEQQGRETANLGAYNNLIGGMSGLGGVSVQSGGGPSTGARVAGAGLGGLGAYGALAMNPVTAPFALAGGGLAALAGLL